jgi:hypothetical protein
MTRKEYFFSCTNVTQAWPNEKFCYADKTQVRPYQGSNLGYGKARIRSKSRVLNRYTIWPLGNSNHELLCIVTPPPVTFLSRRDLSRRSVTHSRVPLRFPAPTLQIASQNVLMGRQSDFAHSICFVLDIDGTLVSAKNPR